MQTKEDTRYAKIDTVKVPKGEGLRQLKKLLEEYFKENPDKKKVYFNFCGITEIIRKKEVDQLYTIYERAYNRRSYINLRERRKRLRRVEEFKKMWEEKNLKLHFKNENAEKGFLCSEEYALDNQMEFIKLWMMLMQYKIEEEGAKLEDIALECEKAAIIDTMDIFEFIESEKYIVSVRKYGDEFEKWLKK